MSGSAIFSPLAENSGSVEIFYNDLLASYQNSAGTDTITSLISANFGNFAWPSNNWAYQINIRNNATNPLSGYNSFIFMNSVGITSDGAGVPLTGQIVELQFQNNAGTIQLRLQTTSAVGFVASTAIFEPLIAGNNSVMIYFDVAAAKIGSIINGVNKGFFQVGGADQTFTFSPNVGFSYQRNVTGDTSGDAGKVSSASLVLLAGLMTETPPGAGYTDVVGNPI